MIENSHQDESNKRDDREKRRAEVRARLEAASTRAQKKKGFMTPERKKKLRALLRRKAAEELKRQQEVKAAERRRVIAERVGEKRNTDNMNEMELRKLCKEFHGMIARLEGEKYDLEFQVSRCNHEIDELSTRVNGSRGRFVKPALKKVPKFNVKIERMLLNARKEVGFTVNLKSVKKDHMKQEEGRQDEQAPEWSWKQKQQADSSN